MTEEKHRLTRKTLEKSFSRILMVLSSKYSWKFTVFHERTFYCSWNLVWIRPSSVKFSVKLHVFWCDTLLEISQNSPWKPRMPGGYLIFVHCVHWLAKNVFSEYQTPQKSATLKLTYCCRLKWILVFSAFGEILVKFL